MLKHVSKGVKRFWAALALLSLEMITILSIFFVSLISFVFIVRNIFLLKDEELDHKVFDWVQPLVNDSTTSFMNVVTFFGKHDFLVPANLLLIAYFLFLRKHKWYSIKIPAIAISSFLLMFGLKRLFGRDRPENQLLEEATNFSFPSGHALMSVTFYGLIAYELWQRIKNPFLRWAMILVVIAWILLIGYSRIYLRRHYYSDVIAGYCIGFLWLVFAIWMLNRMEKYSR
ncbi:MAG TPA: phosphatase PAP2 family protein, partial [Flavisolibacter sp.]